MLKHALLALSFMLVATAPPTHADISETLIMVNAETAVGGFEGYWRFVQIEQDGSYGQTFGCPTQPLALPENVELPNSWSLGSCTVDFGPGYAGRVEFQILAMHSNIRLDIGGTPFISFVDPLRAGRTITLSAEAQFGEVSIRTTPIMVEPNGFVGDCRFEYLTNPSTGVDRNSCDGAATYLPYGVTYQLFAAGRDANPVHISHWGIPFPEGNGRVYRANATTVAFRTIDVQITPSMAVEWDLERIPRSSGAESDPTGPDTLRLVQENTYHLRANPADGPSSRGTLFTLDDRCGAPAQKVFVPNYGLFFVQQNCGTQRP